MGGLSGHMQHPIDILEFTKNDLKDLVANLFNNSISFTEKVDGFNIHASKDLMGNPKFFRNNKDLNSEGMTIGEIVEKYKDNQKVLKVFFDATLILNDFIKNLKHDLTDPDGKYRYTLNCECVSEGITNIMYYNKTIVYIHNIWKWVKIDDKWTVIGIISVPASWECYTNEFIRCTPRLGFTSKPYDNYIVKYYKDKIDEIFGEANTILSHFQMKFLEYISKNEPWILKDYKGVETLFNRFFLNDKSFNLKELKKIYPADKIDWLCKSTYKEILIESKKDIDILFLNLGNDIINRTYGYINENDPIKPINYIKDNLMFCDPDHYQFKRFNSIGEIINPMEGVVFEYKGHLLKLTGSFAPINQLLGSLRMNNNSK